MAVVIDSGPITATDRAQDLPPDQWPMLVAARRRFCAVDLPYDCRELVRFVNESTVMLGPLGYADVTDFVRRGLELDPEMVDWAVRGLRSLKPNDPVRLSDAVELGRPNSGGAPLGNKNAAKDKAQGKQSLMLSAIVSRDYGTSRDYILARLVRDGHTSLHDAVQAGEKSAHAAALEVGYRKQPTALDRLRAAWRKATAEERRIFRNEVTEDL